MSLNSISNCFAGVGKKHMVRAVATALKDIVIYFELSATDLVSDDWGK